MGVQNRKIVDSNFFSCLIIVLFVVGCGFSFYAGIQYESDKSYSASSERLDAFFSNLYESEIYPTGEKEIQTFIFSIPASLNETEKFEAIADWVSNNFSEIKWEESILHNSGYNYVPLLPNNESYVCDPDGKVRAQFKNRYTNDPAWIAYYRTGACGELAALFADVVNRTGNPTRAVLAEFSDGGNHAWVEITRENGDVWYFDPTIYGEFVNYGLRKEGDWTGELSSFELLWDAETTGVYELYSHEDISDQYPQLFDEM